MSIPGSPNLLLMRQAAAAPAGPFRLSTSCRFNSSDSAYLHRTPSATSCRRIWTWSGWFKRSKVASTSTNQQKLFSSKDTDIYIEADKLCLGKAGANNLVTSQVFKDYSSWYHLVVSVNTTLPAGLANQRQRMYINGKEITAFSTRSNLSQNTNTDINLGSNAHRVGANKNTTHFFGGYLCDVHLIDGMELTPLCWGEFSSTTGDWISKEFALHAVNTGVTYSTAGTKTGNDATTGYAIDKFFDGNIMSTPGYAGSEWGNAWNDTRWTLTTAVTVNHELKIYSNDTNDNWGYDIGSGLVQSSGLVAIGSSAPYHWIIPNATQFKGICCGNANQLFGAEIDGVVLIDGVKDGTVIRNDGRTWSSNTSNLNSPSNAFNGTLSNQATNSSTVTITFNPALTDVAYFEHFTANSSAHLLGFNGGTASNDGGGAGWRKPAQAVPSTINSVEIAHVNGNSIELSAVRVDGQILMDGAEGIHGINGLKLWSGHFSASSDSDVGKDYSGQANNYTPVNLSYTADLLTDSPESYGTGTAGGDVRGNFCCWNPLKIGSSGTGDYKEGNLKFEGTNNWKSTAGTMMVSSGKWYYEAKIVGNTYGTASGNTSFAVGYCQVNTPLTDEGMASATTQSNRTVCMFNTGGYTNFGSYQGTVCTPSNGDTIGVALDKDSNNIKFYLNNSQELSLTLGDTTSNLVPYTIAYYAAAFEMNFGAKAFTYTPPAGYKPLCTTHLSDPTIADPTDHFKAIKYEGSGSALTVYGSPFSPDFFWGKGINKDQGHALVDVKRGTGFTLQSDNANQDYSSNNIVTAFNSTGFSLGTDAVVNEDNKTYIAWLWNAPTAFSLTTGDIDSSGYKNTTAGFSIVKYAGNGSGSASQEVPHGLAVRPDMIIVKALDDSTASYSQWLVKHKEMAANNNIKLNDSAAQWNPAGDGWVELGDNATKFKLVKGSSGFSNVNNSGKNYIAYCFAPVAGYSAMGKYVGSSAEPFTITGFRPAYVFLRRMDNNASWYVFDSTRNPYNEVTSALRPNSNVTEQAYNISIMSNGFLIESSSDGDINGAGADYLWYAVAESPFKTARAR